MKNRWEKASRLHRSSISLQINRFPNRCSNLFQWNILSRVWLPRLRNHPRLQPRKLQRSSSTFNPLNTYWEYSTTHTSRIRQLFLRISRSNLSRGSIQLVNLPRVLHSSFTKRTRRPIYIGCRIRLSSLCSFFRPPIRQFQVRFERKVIINSYLISLSQQFSLM